MKDVSEWRYDEFGYLINDFGCRHDGAPCPACVAGEERKPMFFVDEEEGV
jgi:hypothetical protein